jgi:hypothetical protein
VSAAETRTRRGEDGAALVLAVLFMMALSAVGASMMVLARTETGASKNYRLMSQARYAAESGVHKAINYLLNTYPSPGGAGDPLVNYDMTVTPVTYLGQPVVLSAMTGVAANYPDATTAAQFNAAAQGTLAAGGGTVTYRASAQLLSMRTIMAYGSGGAITVIQTWRVTATGSISGGATDAEVEVSGLLERQVVASHTYAAFATDPGCGALHFSGGVVTNSYDSSNMTLSGGVPVTQNTHGDVGTNGNLTETGGTIVNGSLSTPRTGVGNCASGAALTLNGGSQLTGGLIQLPQALTYPAPALPDPLPPTTNMQIHSTSDCATAGLGAGCSGTGGNITLTPGGTAMSIGNLTVNAGAALHLNAGTYNINSLLLTGGADIFIDSGPVIMNVVGTGQTNPIDFTGGSTSNLSFVPADFQIQYAGTGGIKLNGGTTVAAMIYAPNAAAALSGGADFYGSVLARTVQNSGGTRLHYDRSLASEFFTAGNHMLSSFTWKKF